MFLKKANVAAKADGKIRPVTNAAQIPLLKDLPLLICDVWHGGSMFFFALHLTPRAWRWTGIQWFVRWATVACFYFDDEVKYKSLIIFFPPEPLLHSFPKVEITGSSRPYGAKPVVKCCAIVQCYFDVWLFRWRFLLQKLISELMPGLFWPQPDAGRKWTEADQGSNAGS